MMTLRQFSAEPSTIPGIACWYLAGLSKAQGKQELCTHQSPQRLKLLRGHALIESVVSSSRIEGINIGQSRINTLILGKPLLNGRGPPERFGGKRGTKEGNKPHGTKTEKKDLCDLTIIEDFQ